jgi:hypothetical protein
MNSPGPEPEVAIENKFGPFDADEPARAFAQLPKKTRKWLTDLREEDIEEIERARKFMSDAEAAGRFTKWTILTLVGVFGGLYTMIQGWTALKGFFGK